MSSKTPSVPLHIIWCCSTPDSSVGPWHWLVCCRYDLSFVVEKICQLLQVGKSEGSRLHLFGPVLHPLPAPQPHSFGAKGWCNIFLMVPEADMTFVQNFLHRIFRLKNLHRIHWAICDIFRSARTSYIAFDPVQSRPATIILLLLLLWSSPPSSPHPPFSSSFFSSSNFILLLLLLFLRRRRCCCFCCCCCSYQPLTNDHPEKPASYKLSSGGAGLL